MVSYVNDPPSPPPPVYHGDNKEYGPKETIVASSDEQYEVQQVEQGTLKRNLKGRHMQMIAIGGAIGAGLFVGGGSALAQGGPASVLIAFLIIGCMLMLVIQCLAELGVMYPVNGAFFAYNIKFISRSVGFATGWDYAIEWLTVLPFEVNAAGLTLQFWEGARHVNNGVWVAVFLVALIIIQFFGVRGYGETEFILSAIKILACTGFIILAIVIDCGGVPTDDRGYIGAQYWHAPNEAFKNGFKGFAAVFTTASFSFSGTELVGLAAAEAANPARAIPQAAKQVTFRIAFFYILMLFLVGLIVPASDPRLLNGSTSNTKDSVFVIALVIAKIKGLPSVMNAVITVSVLSVANSCTFASSRTLQALAAEGMAPKKLAFIDKAGRPIFALALQICFGFLAFITEAGPDARGKFFNWLLSLSGLIVFFIWGAIGIAYVRFRKAWVLQGRSLDLLPYKAPLGLWGAYIAIALNALCIIAVFYISVSPLNSPASATAFFQSFLAGPLILAFWVGYMLWKRDFTMLIPLKDIDLDTGLRANLDELRAEAEADQGKPVSKFWVVRMLRAAF